MIEEFDAQVRYVITFRHHNPENIPTLYDWVLNALTSNNVTIHINDVKNRKIVASGITQEIGLEVLKNGGRVFHDFEYDLD